MSAITGWAEYTVETGSAEYGEYLEEAAHHLGGLRMHHLGAGRVVLDSEAVEALKRQPEDADGVIERDVTGILQMWLQGTPCTVSPAGA